MSKLIKNGIIASDDWKTLTITDGETPQSIRVPVGPVLVPLSVWKARRAELIHREFEHGWPLGVWLTTEETSDAIEQDIDDFSVIALEFDQSSDGKSYSSARKLRERYGYKGELRAIGDIPRDQLSHLRQVGFDAFTVSGTDYAARKDGTVVLGRFKSAHQSRELAVIAG